MVARVPQVAKSTREPSSPGRIGLLARIVVSSMRTAQETGRPTNGLPADWMTLKAQEPERNIC